MSTYWDLACRDCGDAEMGFNWNHGSDRLGDIWKAATAIADPAGVSRLLAALAEAVCTVNWYAVDGPGLGFVGEFVEKHRGHDVAPLSEYGDYLDECGEYVVCPACEQHGHRRCNRKLGHDGGHARE